MCDGSLCTQIMESLPKLTLTSVIYAGTFGNVNVPGPDGLVQQTTPEYVPNADTWRVLASFGAVIDSRQLGDLAVFDKDSPRSA